MRGKNGDTEAQRMKKHSEWGLSDPSPKLPRSGSGLVTAKEYDSAEIVDLRLLKTRYRHTINRLAEDGKYLEVIVERFVAGRDWNFARSDQLATTFLRFFGPRF